MPKLTKQEIMEMVTTPAAGQFDCVAVDCRELATIVVPYCRENQPWVFPAPLCAFHMVVLENGEHMHIEVTMQAAWNGRCQP